MASVVSALSRIREYVGVTVVDLLLEDLRAALTGEAEIPPQNLIADVKFLGELYNYQMFEANVILDTLYMFILHSQANDPPYETFRIRLVCTLLETCGPYFDTASARRRLDRFLVYLQRYVLQKGIRLPVDVEYMLADTLELVRPNLKWPKTYEEACERVKKIESMKAVALPGDERLWKIEKQVEEDDDSDDDDDSSVSETTKESEDNQKKEQEDRRMRFEALEVDKELQKIIQESLNERKNVRPKPIPNPHALLKEAGIQRPKQPPTNVTPSPLGDAVKFTLLVRKGKQKAKEIIIPKENVNAFAKFQQQQGAQPLRSSQSEDEMADVKNFILNNVSSNQEPQRNFNKEYGISKFAQRTGRINKPLRKQSRS